MSTAATTSKAPSVTGWDRAVVIALGSAGCALSYDALQQMAVAIHVRGFLTYLFPLVIDGFIAFGVRALLVLRDAPLRARIYVWVLFGTATIASIWANALHAVRLNDETTSVAELRLGDAVVAVLSMIAPLALAGAVHLYILIARASVSGTDRGDHRGPGRAGHPGQVGQSDRVPVTRTDRPGQVGAGEPVAAPTDRPNLSLEQRESRPGHPTGAGDPVNSDSSDNGQHDHEAQGFDLPGQPVSTSGVRDRRNGTAPLTGSVASPLPVADRPVTQPPVSGSDTSVRNDRRPDPDTEELLEIARSAVSAEDKLTRKVVAQAIRGQQIPLSSATLTDLMAQLRQQNGQPVTSSQS